MKAGNEAQAEMQKRNGVFLLFPPVFSLESTAPYERGDIANAS